MIKWGFQISSWLQFSVIVHKSLIIYIPEEWEQMKIQQVITKQEDKWRTNILQFVYKFPSLITHKEEDKVDANKRILPFLSQTHNQDDIARKT